MPTIDVGDVLPSFGFTVTSNATGALTAPATFAVTLTAPDGTTPAVTVTNPSTGVYAVTYVTTMPGRYVAVGTATGNGCDGAQTLVWDVDPVTPPLASIVSLDELKLHLNISQSGTDERLRQFALLSSEMVENYTGRTWRTQTFTEKYDGGVERIRLLQTPVQSVTSIMEFSSPVTLFILDPIAGTIARGTSYGGYRWLPGVQNITVTYTAGPANAIVPAAVRLGTFEIARHLWDTMRGGYSIPKSQGAMDEWDPRQGYSIPRRVAEILDPYRAPGF